MTKEQKALFIGKTIADINVISVDTGKSRNDESTLKITFTDETTISLMGVSSNLSSYHTLEVLSGSECHTLFKDVCLEYQEFINNRTHIYSKKGFPLFKAKDVTALKKYITFINKHNTLVSIAYMFSFVKPAEIYQNLNSANGDKYIIADKIPEGINSYIMILHYECTCGHKIPVAFQFGNGVGTPVPEKVCCSKCGVDHGDKYIAGVNLGVDIAHKPIFNFKLM